MPPDRNEPQLVAPTESLVQQLESLRLAGVEVVPAAPPQPTTAAETLTEDVPVQRLTFDVSPRPPLSSSPMPTTQATAALRLAEREAELQVVCSEVASCTQCDELAAQRNQTVFGVGNPDARLCFLGEGPGADEDRTGVPFVGRAGQLLTKIIEACTLTRDDVYILNIVKCRPPGNRNPSPTEAGNCRGFLQRQLDIIQPEYICCLGSVAASNLLDTKLPIGKLRGKLHDWNGIKVLATYHPAYLLRNPSAKADVWHDMQFLMQEMGIPLPTQNV